jgi:predicted phosphodiesterase
MRRLLYFLLRRPLTWLAKFTGSPHREAVFRSLGRLYKDRGQRNSRVITLHLPDTAQRFVVFSDQHKGNGDSGDDFRKSEANYIAALRHYQQEGFTFINLGDSEELWKYKVEEVLPRSTASLAAEAAFQQGGHYLKVYGNHDVMWKNSIDANRLLKPYFALPLPVYEAVVLHVAVGDQSLNILLTHGHQGDTMSDNNPLSTWLVAHLWAPLQRYLQINVNAPSTDGLLRNKHNRIMYEWSSHRKNLLLVTGHTHQPVFASGRYSSHPSNQFDRGKDEKLRPTYFNTGCCCFSDGDITGIEIADGYIRLIKWCDEGEVSFRKVLEEKALAELMEDLGNDE